MSKDSPPKRPASFESISGTVTSEPKKVINLALQGGGAHGAFTWGVLDRLLEEESLEIEGISATSAGAMNAAVVAYGYLKGGRYKARKLLDSFWRKISHAAALSPLQPTFMDKIMGSNDMVFSPAVYVMDFLTRLFSPYQFNLFNINPLQDVLADLIDFRELRQKSPIRLFINATNVRTGKPKIFDDKELTLDMVLASNCFPFLFKAAEIGGEAYWDGGYAGNPALTPLVKHCKSRDIVVIQIHPMRIDDVPTHAEDILERVNEISFNTSLLKEVKTISLITELVQQKKLSSQEYREIYFHLLEAEEIMVGLGRHSKFNADWDFLMHLKETGRQAAGDWLEAHFAQIGRDSTVDIEQLVSTG